MKVMCGLPLFTNWLFVSDEDTKGKYIFLAVARMISWHLITGRYVLRKGGFKPSCILRKRKKDVCWFDVELMKISIKVLKL